MATPLLKNSRSHADAYINTHPHLNHGLKLALLRGGATREAIMNAQLKIVETPSFTEDVSPRPGFGRDRRKAQRCMVAVRARVCANIGTLHMFEEILTCLDISRDGVRLPTSRPGYTPGQILQVTCPFWEHPTAINTPRTAKVIRCVVTPTFDFEVALQFVPDVGEEALLLRRPSSSPASQVRVLVVESDQRASRALRDLLERDGYHVVTVEKARQGLDVIQTEAPHVIVAEAECDEISGHDLCAIVKTTASLQHIPVILLTGSAMPSDYAMGHSIGAVVCMTRPYKMERVRQAVRLVACPPSQSSAYSAAFNVASFVRTT
jgi:CheY-like chemotaxis protein